MWVKLIKLFFTNIDAAPVAETLNQGKRVVGPIEILPPLSPAHAAAAARAIPIDPASRSGRPGPRPAPAEVVIDVEAGEPQGPASAGAKAGGERAGRRRARPPQPMPERRALYGTTPAGAANGTTLRETGTVAYRSADGLIADAAHRGAFFDLKV
ncbi:MAG TPA: hypothetical protein VMV26_05575 [Alphaproteobacteria bacterium]|nr:hypothetical protein [Alphaproteobacteria bacterium]